MFAYKVVMVGDFGVGKTSLVQRFVDNSFSEEYLSSIGVSISKKNLISKNDIDSKVMLWDIEGRTESKPIFKQYLMGAKAFIIVVDLTSQKSIDSVKDHLKTCLESVPTAPICIALNKNDLETKLSVDSDIIKKMSPNIISVQKSSAKSGEAVNEIFTEINEELISRLKLA